MLDDFLNVKKTHNLNINVEFDTSIEITPNILKVSEAFGLGISEAKKFIVFDNFKLSFNDGDIIYITGDSGGGKSILLKEIKKYYEENKKKYIDLEALDISNEDVIVESIGTDLDEAIYFLSMMGLNDAFIFLRQYKHLSDGQKYRYRLAKAISMKPDAIFIDEYCANLDRTTAKVISYNLQRTLKKFNISLYCATTHRDIDEDLNYTVKVDKKFMDEVNIEYRIPEKTRVSFYDDVVVSVGSIDDYKKLNKYHYKNTSSTLPYKKIFKATYNDELVGVVVYSPPFLQTKGRTIKFGKTYTKMEKEVVKEINKNFIRLSRIVLSPKYRACGLAVKLMKESMPLTGTPYVEMINVMGHYNPFGEKAGMEKIEITEETDAPTIRLDKWMKEKSLNIESVHNPIYFEKWCDSLSEDDKNTFVRMMGKVMHHPKLGLSSKDGRRIEVVAQEKRYSEVDYKEVRDEILKHVPKLYSGTTLYYIWKNNDYVESINESNLDGWL